MKLLRIFLAIVAAPCCILSLGAAYDALERHTWGINPFWDSIGIFGWFPVIIIAVAVFKPELNQRKLTMWCGLVELLVLIMFILGVPTLNSN